MCFFLLLFAGEISTRCGESIASCSDNEKIVVFVSSKSLRGATLTFVGKCFLSKFLNIPEQVPFDYLHLVLQGHFKWLLKKLFLDKHSGIFIGKNENLVY